MKKQRSPRCRLKGTSLRGDVCGLVAVIAISGTSEQVARDAIRSAGNERGLSIPENFESSRFRDQARAIEMLGGTLFNVRNELIQARDIDPNRRWPKDWVHEQVTIEQFLEWYSKNGGPDRMLVHATGPAANGADLVSHTFTLDRGWFFDNNTPVGRPIRIADAIKSALPMHVVDVLIVRRSAGRRKGGA